ncbi:activated protein kinase catalytic subunit alpha-1 [Seminavis robusta]|uniref:Activated protein kinase catalytic subunit alpha-1 n=1 Tax=Seminavis robusta TaxID=568900 RepID=A0A9N8E7Y5_9STRA|nr:activated protein kinase catalytic subunit alpha-1 [Seminavis robusta]|eukprot:Sro608_g174890.1 activated protein kinase catalytic subunit alpha-1 (1429) ;mRNA; r:48826-54187
MMIGVQKQRLVVIWLCLCWLASSTSIAEKATIVVLQDGEAASKANATNTTSVTTNNHLCPHDRVIPFNPARHQKRVYKVGVLAIRGFEAAYNEFNTTFQDYLTATAGQRFDPPLEFELVPLNFKLLFTDTEQGLVDFIYVNPSAFSCIESEFTAHSLVSQVSRRKIHGNEYHLKMFGGVIMKRANDERIQSIHDLTDKVIAAASISGLGSGQMQFLELQKAGMSYINDPKQLVFTSNQGKVVKGVLSGKFDVGFVRTDQIERTKDANGTLLDPNLFSVIDPVPDLNIDGDPFPFEASTPLYPEWNLAALRYVADDVSQAVQSSMLALADHASVAVQYHDCVKQFPNHTDDFCHFDNLPKARCDTTQEVAEIALAASQKGKYAAWTTTLSYMQLRSMQEVTGFINMDPADNIFKCTRPSTLYDSITCPEGYYKASEQVVNQACSTRELSCEEGFQCICSPCLLIQTCNHGVEIRGKCVSYSIFLPAILVPFFLLCAIAVHYYVEYKRKQADSIWAVQPDELEFESPQKVLGKGTFGYVLLAEYRGTKVAVKRVIPPKGSSRLAQRKSRRAVQHSRTMGSDDNTENRDSASDKDIESQVSSNVNLGLKSMGPEKMMHSLDNSLNRRNPGMRSMASRLASLTGSNTGTLRKPPHSDLKQEFMKEMQHLSKLRHPCITTVMGAVVAKGAEPMLVMEYMNQGSLHDVLKDETIELDTDEHLIPILQDIAQGMRFLHAANPTVIHGDLKAKNVLVDNKFRAKVTDFGLSAKKSNNASGTPYWMAPELLRGDSTNTAKSDIYAFGILIYEIFSRKDPYEGENHIEVLRKICDPFVNKRPPIPDGCSFKMAELMTECLSLNPAARPTAELVDVAVRVEGSVKERTSKLEQLNRELEEANKKIETASSMQLEHFACMSHEIRTPLNCIVGLSSLMEESNLNASQAESIGMIASSSRLLQSIVDDVLDFSKLQSGNAEVDIKKTDIQRVVADLASSMRASVLAKKRNVNIESCFTPLTRRYVETDGRRLLQILFNLVSNAVKFSKNDGVVKVAIDVCPRTWPIGEKEPQEDDDGERKPLVKFAFKVLRFTVKDFGKGIETHNFDRIFQPFTQTNSGVNNIDGGTGLGLAITEKLIRALGGDIRVDSVVSEWTEFTVDFPHDEPPPCIHDISTKFTRADIYTVGENQHMSDIFTFFNVKTLPTLTMAEVEKALQQQPKPPNAEKRANLCVVQASLFDKEITERLSKNFGMRVVIIGPMKLDMEGVKHYQYLGEVVPSNFMADLGDLVNESLNIQRSERINHELTASARVSADLTKLRILCAEDNLVNQKILVRMLKRVGVSHIVVVENGKLAVEREAEEEFDIVLMDMQMPVMDGIDATKLILAREGGHKLPLVVFVTAHVSSTFETQCMECGATAYLPKPYTLPVMKATLTEVAEKLL